MALHDEAVHMQHLLDRLAHAANGVIARLWHNSGGDPDTMARWYPTALQPFLSASSGLGAQWYRQTAPDVGYPVVTVPPPPADELAASVRWATSPNPFSALSQEAPATPADPLDALTGATERHVYDAHRDTIVTNANRENVMFARYASASACAFCRLLATRTTLYSGKGVVTDPDTGKQKLVVIGVGRSGRTRGTRKVGQDYHDNCKCMAVPVRPGGEYHPPDYVDGWRQQYETAWADPDSHSFKDIVNHMRRQEYHADKLSGALGDAGLSAAPEAQPVS